MLNKSSKGYLFAFGASLALALSFIFSKSLLNEVTIIEFGMLWFSLGFLWNLISFLTWGQFRGLRTEFRKKLGVALLIALLEGAATWLFYLAIQAMENPAIVSFIGNTGPVFVTIMGILLLAEKFNRWQIAGIITTIAGVFIINYREGGFTGFLDPGSLYVILASFLFAVATITGRAMNRWLEPGFMSLLRSLILAVTFIVLFVLGDMRLSLNPVILRDSLLGSMFETLITIVFAYQALRLIEATRTSLIISSKAIWTLILAWIFLDVFPSGFQMAGGALTLLGVWLITRENRIIQKE